MSYVKSSETENYTDIDWLLYHVTGDFDIFEHFRKGVEFFVSGIGPCKLVDYELYHNFENESNPVWMVFELNGKLFKIEGSKNSYGSTYWYRHLKSVRKREAVTFEYV